VCHAAAQRHEAGINFPDYQREQFFGHGDAIFPTTSFDQVHIQFEKDGAIRTILYDQVDWTRYNLPCMADHCGSTPEEWVVNPHCYRYFANGTGNPVAEACWRSGMTSASTDTHPAIRDYDNGLWHHLVLTTRPDGQKGFNQYLDGVLRAASPYVQGVGEDKGYADLAYLNHLGVGGDPIDPVGDIRLCGRKKPAVWSDEDAEWDFAQYDPRRYFRGKVAHFAVWDSALSQEQVNDLHKSYVDKYGLTVTPFEMPSNIPTPMAYYFMDEGHGWDLKESVSQDSMAGRVNYVEGHQVNHNYTEPNWIYDDVFGRTIACGEISNKTHPELGSLQKDFITLNDVAYGANGRWAISVWYK